MRQQRTRSQIKLKMHVHGAHIDVVGQAAEVQPIVDQWFKSLVNGQLSTSWNIMADARVLKPEQAEHLASLNATWTSAGAAASSEKDVKTESDPGGGAGSPSV